MSYKQYPSAFKVDIVLEVLREEKELGEIAAEHNLNPNMVRNWKAEFLKKADSIFEGNRKAEKEKSGRRKPWKKKKHRCSRPLASLRWSVIFFRTAFAAKATPSPDLICKSSELSVRRQCELLGLTRSQVYYQWKQPDQESIERKEAVMDRIDYWHTMLPAIGARKLKKQLKLDGYTVNRKTIRKYMEEMGIKAIYPKANLSKRNFKEAIVPYLLRNYTVRFPNPV